MDEPHNQTYTYTPSINNSNTNWNHDFDFNIFGFLKYNQMLLYCLILPISVLGICFTVFGLYSVIKTDHFVPVYVVNLFICDLIQTSSTLILFFNYLHPNVNYFGYYMSEIYYIAVVVNILFMVCISAERYIMIAHPVWYRNMNTIRKVFVSVTIWIICVVLTIIIFFCFEEHIPLCALLYFILPYPLVIIFFVGTWRALSRNTTIPPQGQRQIMRTLGLVLFIYTVLFLPFIISMSIIAFSANITFTHRLYLVSTAEAVIRLNPLFDFLLYLVLRKDAKDLFCTLFCFCKRHVQNSATDTMKDQV